MLLPPYNTVAPSSSLTQHYSINHYENDNGFVSFFFFFVVVCVVRRAERSDVSKCTIPRNQNLPVVLSSASICTTNNNSF
jgi:hypothetical protein